MPPAPRRPALCPGAALPPFNSVKVPELLLFQQLSAVHTIDREVGQLRSPDTPTDARFAEPNPRGRREATVLGPGPGTGTPIAFRRRRGATRWARCRAPRRVASAMTVRTAS